MCNVAALVGVLVLSVRLVKPSLDKTGDLAARSGAEPPGPAPQSGADHHRLRAGQPVRHLPRHVGSAQRTPDREAPAAPRGGHRAGGGGQAHAAALRPVSRADPSLAWGVDLRAHVRALRAGDLRCLADVLEGLLDEGHLQAGSCRRPLDRGQPEPLGRPRPVHARRPARWPDAPAARRDRRRRPPAGGPGAPPLITAPGRAHLRGDVPPRLPHLVGPSHGLGRAGDPVAGLRTRPAALGARPRRRRRRSCSGVRPSGGCPTRTRRISISTCSQLVAGNSFFFAMLLFLGGAAVLVHRRGHCVSAGRTFSSPDCRRSRPVPPPGSCPCARCPSVVLVRTELPYSSKPLPGRLMRGGGVAGSLRGDSSPRPLLRIACPRRLPTPLRRFPSGP